MRYIVNSHFLPPVNTNYQTITIFTFSHYSLSFYYLYPILVDFKSLSDSSGLTHREQKSLSKKMIKKKEESGIKEVRAQVFLQGSTTGTSNVNCRKKLRNLLVVFYSSSRYTKY